MPLRYSAKVNNVALSTTTDMLALYAAANRSLRIVEISVGGMGTASAANALGVYRVGTVGITPSGAVAATPLNPAAPAAAALTATGWGTQPVVAASPLLILPFNANGGIFRWVAPPYGEIEVPGGGLLAASSISFRSVLGTSNVTLNVIFDEF